MISQIIRSLVSDSNPSPIKVTDCRFSQPTQMETNSDEHDERRSSFVPLRKRQKQQSEDNFISTYYTESSEVTALTEGEVASLMRNFNIQVEGVGSPRPIFSFSHCNLSPELSHAFRSLDYERPTAIQMQTIPCLLSGRDVIANAPAGSGKTLAYVLPLLVFLRTKPQTHPAGCIPHALILGPTRELVEQILTELNKLLPSLVRTSSSPGVPSFGTGHPYQHQRPHHKATTLHPGWNHGQPYLPPFRAAGVYGGVSVGSQISTLGGVDVVVATPGRLIDLLEKEVVHLNQVEYLVFDEADQMLSESLEPQLRKIVAMTHGAKRQTVLISATHPIAVERLARSAVMNPIHIRVGDAQSTDSLIEHEVIFLQTFEKKKTLLEVLRSTPKPPVFVFCAHQNTAEKICSNLRSQQFHAGVLHGGMEQEDRFSIMKAYKEEKLDVLVATNLASRGIDVSDVTLVVNYDMPDTIEDYIHRAGRTARAGKTGRCVSFLSYDCTIAAELKDLLIKLKQPIPDELHNLKQFGGRIVSTEFGDKVVYS